MKATIVPADKREAIALRLWAKADRSAGDSACWPWKSAVDAKGNARFSLNRSNELAARIVYALQHQEGVPVGAMVTHDCGNAACVNPAHLKLSSSSVGVRKRRHRGSLIKRSARPSREEIAARRFWSHVDVIGPDNCWPWSLAKHGRGYGAVTIGGRTFTSHRVAFCLAHGFDLHRLSRQLLVCHTCDNRVCCNPEHLFLGEAVDNTRDMIRKGRKALQTGEDASSAKLSRADVEEIRQRRSVDGESWASLGRTFGVTAPAVRAAAIGVTWK